MILDVVTAAYDVNLNRNQNTDKASSASLQQPKSKPHKEKRFDKHLHTFNSRHSKEKGLNTPEIYNFPA